MGVIQVNLPAEGEARGGGFQPKTPGWYDFRCTSVEDKAIDGKAPATIIKGEIVGGQKHVGDTISNFMTHDSWNGENWRALLDQTNVPYEVMPDGRGGEGLKFDTEHLIGKIVGIKIAIREKNGKKYENWVEYAQPQFVQSSVPAQGAAPSYQYPPNAQPPMQQPPNAQPQMQQPPQGYAQPPQGYQPPPGYNPQGNQGR